MLGKPKINDPRRPHLGDKFLAAEIEWLIGEGMPEEMARGPRDGRFHSWLQRDGIQDLYAEQREEGKIWPDVGY